MSRVQYAVVLAGGTGSRMESINGLKPKLLTEVNGQSLLEIQLRNITLEGIEKVLYLLGEKSDYIVPKLQHLQNEYGTKIEIDWIVENKKLGTGGSILNAVELMEEIFTVIYGDLYIDLNLSDLGKKFIQSNSDFACVAHPSNHMFDSNLIISDSGNNIIQYCPKGKSQGVTLKNLANSGIYFFRKNTLSKKSLTVCDLDIDIIPDLINEGKKGVVLRHHGIVKDVGTPERLFEMQKNQFPSQFHRLKRPTLFLDRDGVINRHVGHIVNESQVEIMPAIGNLIARFNMAKYWVLVVTNQPVVSHGKVSITDLYRIHSKIDQELSQFGAYIDEFYFCPHHPDKGFEGEVASLKIQCQCRKPEIGLFNYATEMFKIDLEKSLMIGDTWRDESFAKTVGIPFISLANLTENDILFTFVLNQVFPIENWWNI